MSAIPRFYMKINTSSRDYAIYDRQLCDGDNPVARASRAGMADIIVDALNAKEDVA